MRRNQTARQHNFGIVPAPQVPRSKFLMQQTRKMAFDASDLIPIMCEEVLPGDTWQHTESIMARLATPIAPVVDDLSLETWYFWVPLRILATTFGGNAGPGEPTGPYKNEWEAFITGTHPFTIPKLYLGPAGGGTLSNIPVGSVPDHFGIPPGNYTAPVQVTAFPFWAYFMIYNEWYRDQNLQEMWNWPNQFSTSHQSDSIGYGEDVAWNLMPLRVNKRHDYFTGSLPFAQKGDPVELSLGVAATVRTSPTDLYTGVGAPMQIAYADGTGPFDQQNNYLGTGANAGADANKLFTSNTPAGFAADVGVYPSNLYADLSAASAITINEMRLAIITQQMLERDARTGSRYVENLLGHWGVRLPDYTANRPEYLGGSKIDVTVNPIAQTAAYDAEPANAPSAVGNLGAEMHASQGGKRTFTHSAHEHGYIIGLAAARATPTYQQGFRRHWLFRNNRFDYWDPLFSNLGEQAVNTVEIFMPLNTGPTNVTWGYQEQGAEYRYTPNEITGVLRSTAAQPLDWWHYAEEFATEPALNADFITDKTKETLARSLATAPSAQWSAQIIMDILHESHVMRLMPAYSVPGIDRI